MDLPESLAASTQRIRSVTPPPCPGCDGPAWWNGWRRVFPQLPEGRVERWLARGRCKSGCVDFVVRPRELYPHRQYQPDVVARVVADAALGEEPYPKAAAKATASATSARRWTKWVTQLVDAGAVLALAGRLMPDAAVGAGLGVTATASPARGLAAGVLRALEYLGEALVRSGVALISKSGLGRLLEWQLGLHGDVVHLVAAPNSFSPGMALGLPGGLL